jgi:cobalt-zinc-cadmium efflux system outer membrane protein
MKRFVLCAVLAAYIAPPAVGAGSTDEQLTLQAAIERALKTRPELAEFAFALRAQEARTAAAGLRPAPEAELLLEDAAGTDARRGLESAQTTLSLSQVIELGGKRVARATVAQQTRTRFETERAARQLDVLADVARRFVEVLHEQEQLDVAREAVALAERARSAVDQRVRAARSPEAESLRADAAFARATLELEHAGHNLESSRYWLAAAMGDRQPQFVRASGDLQRLQVPPPFEELMARVERSPDQLIFADEARLRDAELRLAQARRYPDIRASIGARRYEEGDDVAWVAGFTVPLFSSKYAQPQIDMARAERERADTSREAALLKARAQLFEQYQELQHARIEVTGLREQVLPKLEQALTQTEYAYERGRYSYMEWSDAQRELLQTRRRLIDAVAEYHKYRIEIERLTGEPLMPAGGGL